MSLPQLLALAAAAATAAAVDRLAERRRLLPPGFREPRRRLVAGTIIGFALWAGVFGPAAAFEASPDFDLDSVTPLHIFAPHLLLMTVLAAWIALGVAGVPGLGRKRALAVLLRQLGLRVKDVAAELRLALIAGVAAWVAVLAAALAFGLLVTGLGGKELISSEPSELIVWMAGLPVALRLGISLAAGVVEELFFRGFLQPRVGIAASTALFVCAHLGYGQPLMLFGITLLSLLYARLTSWRGNVVAAMGAHFLFDAIQLLVVIPAALRAYETGAPGAASVLGRALGIC